MIVLLDEFTGQAFQLRFAQHDDVVKQLPAQRAAESLDVRVLPWTPERRADLLNAAAFQERLNPPISHSSCCNAV